MVGTVVAAGLCLFAPGGLGDDDQNLGRFLLMAWGGGRLNGLGMMARRG